MTTISGAIDASGSAGVSAATGTTSTAGTAGTTGTTDAWSRCSDITFENDSIGTIIIHEDTKGSTTSGTSEST
jgi:hypothetical protein